MVGEHDNAKDEERYSKYQKLIAEEAWPWLQKSIKEGLYKYTGLSDNTGHIIGIYEFENFEAFEKMWNDPAWNSMMIKMSQLVDNNRIRICRSGRPVEPEEVA